MCESMISMNGRDLRYFALNKKHIRQYDIEFMSLADADELSPNLVFEHLKRSGVSG